MFLNTDEYWSQLAGRCCSNSRGDIGNIKATEPGMYNLFQMSGMITVAIFYNFWTLLPRCHTQCIIYIVCMLSHFSRVWLFVTLCTIASQAPLSRGFSRQGYWSGLPCPPPGDLPDPEIKPTSLTPLALAGVFFAMSTCYRHYLL